MKMMGRALVLVAALAAARVLEAQTVRGEITDRVTGRPVTGAVVLLLDASDRAVAQSLADARGRYQLLSPAPGTFRVRALRIGFRPATSQPFTLAAGAVLDLQPLQSGARVALDTVHVVGRNSCEIMNDARATFALWEQARTALTAARITAGERLVSARVLIYQRASRPRSGEVLAQHAAELRGITRRPWHSVSPDSLRRAGYIVHDERNWVHFLAPDLDVLLSDEFLGDHCFRIAPESDDRRIGIAFAPTRERRNLPEIAGTLWLDRASSELRLLEFRYVNVADEIMDARAGGTLEFAALRDGAWAVSRWNIRMPVVEQRDEAASGIRSRARVVYREVTEIREEGGILAMVTQGEDTLYRARAITITGTVRDSVRGTVVPAATVVLRGAGLRTIGDAQGRFRLSDVLPGRYIMEFRTPALEALGSVHTEPVTVADSALALHVSLPSAEQLADRACRGGNRLGVVAGVVYQPGGGAPASAGTRVVGEYRERQLTTDSAGDAARYPERSRAVTATTDLHGRYRLCQVPVGSSIHVVAETDSISSAPVVVTIPDTQRVAVVDLVLDRQGRPAAFTGQVMSDVDGRPIPEAQVLLPDLPRVAFTDDAGAFRISNIPAGTHRVLVRRLGQRQLDMTLTFAPNQTLERRLLLSRVVTLDTVAVRARAEIPSFEENRRLGLGKFWTRDTLATMEGRRLSEVLSATPGLDVVRGWGNAAWIATGRGGRGGLSGSCFDLEGGAAVDTTKQCGCYAAVYLDNIPIFQRRPARGAVRDEVPDINRIPVSAIESIEFYSGPASIPPKYSTLNSNCGVLVIHTRRTLEPDGWG